MFATACGLVATFIFGFLSAVLLFLAENRGVLLAAIEILRRSNISRKSEASEKTSLADQVMDMAQRFLGSSAVSDRISLGWAGATSSVPITIGLPWGRLEIKGGIHTLDIQEGKLCNPRQGGSQKAQKLFAAAAESLPKDKSYLLIYGEGPIFKRTDCVSLPWGPTWLNLAGGIGIPMRATADTWQEDGEPFVLVPS